MPDPHRTLSRTTEDLLYDSFFSASIGAFVVALFLLLMDAAQGQLFFTPSLLGAVMFEGADATAVTDVRLDMVAYYSVVHMSVFFLLGAILAFLVHEVELHSRHPVQIFLLFFLVFEGSFLVASQLFMPGVNEVLGHFRIFLANLFAVGAMAIYLYQSHTEGAWQRFKHAAHLS